MNLCPSTPSPRCPCDTGTISVYHVLFACPTWSALRTGILSAFRTTDLRKLLNNQKGAKAAVKFVLQTDLLAQFRLIARAEHAKRLGPSDLALDINANNDHIENEDEAENEQDNTYPSLGTTGTSQAESTP